MSDPDVERMLRVREGDVQAFDQLFVKYRAALVHFAARWLHDRARAEDVAQEVFLRLYRARAAYEPRTHFRSYLYRITRNTCMNHARSLRNTAALDEDMPDPTSASPESDAIAAQLARHANDVFAYLPPSQQRAFLLLRAEEMSYGEIAIATGRTLGSVKSLLNRAKREMLRAVAAPNSLGEMP